MALSIEGVAATRTIILHARPSDKRLAGLTRRKTQGHGAKRSHQEQPAKMSNGRPGDLLWHTRQTKGRRALPALLCEGDDAG
ncbi:hypothetical protein X756_07165 [Mesorhizobium sp. LSHC412B00]|nr:hypothetical protein X756_07165 [Mesorhizobium sp. LSHC412B00]